VNVYVGIGVVLVVEELINVVIRELAVLILFYVIFTVIQISLLVWSVAHIGSEIEYHLSMICRCCRGDDRGC
jgi:hypothetical protein